MPDAQPSTIPDDPPPAYCHGSSGSALSSSTKPAALQELSDQIGSGSKGDVTTQAQSPDGTFKGTDHIIHSAARQDDQKALQRAIGYILTEGLDVDVRNTDGLTALEIAIRVGYKANVEVLLKRGASVRCRNERWERPLHFAIRCKTSSSICQLLLKNGANPNSPMQDKGVEISPLQFAVLDKGTLSPANLRSYLQIVGLLVLSSDRFDAASAEGEHIYRSVLYTIRRSPYCLDDCFGAVSDSLKLFLKKGCDPLVLQAIEPCRADRCRSLAASVFFHTAEPKLSMALIGSCKSDTFGRGLLYTLLEPCPSRCSPEDGPRPDELIRHLLARDIGVDLARNPLCRVMATSPAKCKSDFARVLLTSGYASIHTRDSHFGSPLAVLTELDEPLRYELAEIVLEPDYDLWTRERTVSTQQLTPQIFAYNPFNQYGRYLAPDFKQLLRSYWAPTTPTNTQLTSAMRCVIHVLTKHLVEDALFGTSDFEKRSRWLDGMKLRQEHQLPEIPLANVATYNMDMLTNTFFTQDFTSFDDDYDEPYLEDGSVQLGCTCDEQQWTESQWAEEHTASDECMGDCPSMDRVDLIVT